MIRALTLAAILAPAPALAAQTLWLRTVGNAVPGEPLTVRVSGAAAGAPLAVAVGDTLAPAATCPGGLPVCVDVANARVQSRGVADNAGAVELTVVVPVGARPGDPLALQAVDTTGGDTSAAVAYTVSRHLPIVGVYDDLSGVYGQIEIDDQGTRDDIMTTTFADFDAAAGVAYATWVRPNGWPYWMRLEWVESAGQTWICWSMPNPAEATVRRMTASDRSNPAVGGCSGGAWLELSPADPTLTGRWRDDLGARVSFDADGWSWGSDHGPVARFSNLDRVILGRNARGTPNAGRYTRVDTWIDPGGDAWACRTATRRTLWAARSQPPADPDDLGGGCAGGPWSALVP
jgi:hypothetical protein